MSMSNEELAVAIQQGHTEYITQLWDNNQKLFNLLCNRWWTAHSERFTQCGLTQQDLMQECYFILIDAVAAYDSDSGFKFASYFRYPMQNRFNTLLGYRSRRGGNPLNNCYSLNAPVACDEDIEALETIPDPKQPFDDILHADYVAQLHIDLEGAIKRKLTAQQQDILCDYYYSGLSKSAIAEKYGLTRAKVHDILKNSYGKMSNDLDLRQKYGNEILQDRLFKGTGFVAFKNNGMSSVERTIEIIERTETTIRKRCNDEWADKLHDHE